MNVTLPEMIAIVNNGARDYKVTLSVFDGIATLVAVSRETDNVYTVDIPNLRCRGYEYRGERLLHGQERKMPLRDLRALYESEQLIIYTTYFGCVKIIKNRTTHYLWDVDEMTVKHSVPQEELNFY